jgi:hypothetical protein
MWIELGLVQKMHQPAAAFAYRQRRKGLLD